MLLNLLALSLLDGAGAGAGAGVLIPGLDTVFCQLELLSFFVSAAAEGAVLIMGLETGFCQLEEPPPPAEPPELLLLLLSVLDGEEALVAGLVTGCCQLGVEGPLAGPPPLYFLMLLLPLEGGADEFALGLDTGCQLDLPNVLRDATAVSLPRTA